MGVEVTVPRDQSTCLLRVALRFIGMNSYPAELLLQHAPLMFVAGLEPPQSPPPALVIDNTATSPLSPQGALIPESRDPFAVLTGRLRNALITRRRGAIWDSDKTHRFNVLLVDKVCGMLLGRTAID